MSLGSMITKARIDANLSIEDLSAATNIRSSLLKEMEADYFANCGGETYARGHIKNIASKIGVNPQEFTDAYELEQLKVIRSMQDLLVETSAMRQPGEEKKVSWKVLITISLSSLFVLGLTQIINTNTSSDQATSIETSNSAQTSPTPSPSATSQTNVAPNDQSTISTGQGVEVIVSASRARSWLFVSDATGRTLFTGQLSQGVVKTFTTDVGLNLRIGNAGGVDLEVNGKQIDSVGVDGQVVSVSYGVDS